MLLLAVVGATLLASLVRTLAPAFIPVGRTAAAGSAGRGLRGVTARRADEKEGGDGGFLKFLKVEQDIELSPEEYAMALEQEVESQRKRYYIGGVVKENNLIVPWRPVDEKMLMKDARKQLRKNGIMDPAGEIDPDEEDSGIELALVGQEDVYISWTAGIPGSKVGYIVEKKKAKDTNFQEVASYESTEQGFLLAKPYAGHNYAYSDELCGSGSWTYRVLCRYRSGEIQVIDQKEIVVPELTGVKFEYALVAFLVIFIAIAAGSFFADKSPVY